MEAASRPRLVVVCGPTASGKTALAIALAKRLGCTIWSADSRQCYREMNMGVARPLPNELAMVPHGFVATHPVQAPVDAARFARLGHEWILRQHQAGKPTIVCGGTGLYLQALTQGLHQMPPTDPELRARLQAAYESKGLGWLQSEVQEADPDWYAQGEVQNPARLLRALEVKLGTGHSLIHWWSATAAPPDYDCLWLGLDLPKAVLHQRIAERTTAMLAAGLVAEAAALQPHRHLPALNTVGYKECFAVLDGQLPGAALEAEIALRTRQYAKRQLTWFRRLPQLRWLAGNELEPAWALVSEWLGDPQPL